MPETDTLLLLLGEFQDKLDRLKDLVPRDAKFPHAPGKIKVAIGMRRAGKTYFLYQHILQLLEHGVDRKTILYLNFEDDRLLPLDEKKLARLLDSFYTLHPENHGKLCYLFLDEIQNVPNWPIVIRRFQDTKQVEIFLTGSSAKLLSKEIATNLRGRSLAIEIWPYSFQEFLRAKKITIDQRLYSQKIRDHLAQIFHQYLTEGGFPEIVPFESDVKNQTLQEYLHVTLYRDIIERHEIIHHALIKYMILTMIHNVGKPFTINKFYHDCKNQGYQISRDLLYDYAKYIEDAYLAFSLGIYDRSIRKVQTNPKKIYTIDSGLTRAITLEYENDFGRLFEGVVYLDLRRLGCKVSYFLTQDRYEIDFLAQTPQGQKKFFQVAWDTENPNTLQREQRALEAGMKELNIEGEIITLDSYLRHGVRI